MAFTKWAKHGERKLVDFWVIISAKKQAIWKGTFNSYQEAEDERVKQMSMLSDEQKVKADWKVEKHSCWIEITKSKRDQELDEAWSDFD
jgi:hypothetical protein